MRALSQRIEGTEDVISKFHLWDTWVRPCTGYNSSRGFQVGVLKGITQMTLSSPVLGCIADDFTGATDLAGALVLNGMRTVVELGSPGFWGARDCDAVVVALKSRNATAVKAIAMSLEALRRLRSRGCRRFLFKYCSTFDSTAKGNIGPVAEALMDELNTDFTIVCPSVPANRRTTYNGYLFVNGALLEESGMRLHPLNPMTDSNLVRLLQAQSRRKVGLVSYPVVQAGAAAISEAIKEARKSGVNIAVVDAVSQSNLREIASACQSLPLLTGASGIAMEIPGALRAQGLIKSYLSVDVLPHVPGFSAIISGSCSEATQRQVASVSQRIPTFRLDPLWATTDPGLSHKVELWASARVREGPVLIAATADTKAVRKVQAQLGGERAGQVVEDLLADIAQRLIMCGVRRFIVSGGETSGAVLTALGVRSLCVGPQIDPGVHWSVSEGKMPLAFALKSGNFGGDDLFDKAWGLLS